MKTQRSYRCAFRPTCGCLVVLTMALSSPGVWADVKVAQTPGEGWVFIDEGLSEAMQGETELHFNRARDLYLAHDTKAAATEIRKGAVVLRLESSRASGEARSALVAAESGLQALATKIEGGVSPPLRSLDMSFARAEHALAVHHQRKARQYWEHHDLKSLAQDLRHAADHLEQYLTRLGRGISREAEAALGGARHLAGRLDKTSKTSEKEVRDVLDKLDSELRRNP